MHFVLAARRLVAIPLGGLALLSIVASRAGLSLLGWAWVSLLIALAALSWRSTRRTTVATGIAFGFVVVGLAVGEATKPDRVRLVRIDRQGDVSEAVFPERLFDERDSALVGAQVLVWLGAVKAPEFPDFPAVLREAYGAVELTRGSPVQATLFGLQRPARSTTVFVDSTAKDAHVGVVFLHGYGGNFALQCLVVARAVEAFAVTACPSVGFDGAWWTDDGEATVRGAIAALKKRGAKTIVLSGLSNGGAGASLLAGRLAAELSGLVLLSGVADGAELPAIPTLLIQGNRDGMMRTPAVRAWFGEHRHSQFEYLELEGTHFLILERRDEVGRALVRFCRALR